MRIKVTGVTEVTAKRVRLAGTLGLACLEAFVLVEILWYYLHDGESTLHGAAGEWFGGYRERVQRRVEINETIAHIRNLPEVQ